MSNNTKDFCPKHGKHAPGECPKCDELAEARMIVGTTFIPSAAETERPCTCHPDDRSPVCQRRYAATECQKAYMSSNLVDLRAKVAAIDSFPEPGGRGAAMMNAGTGCSEYLDAFKDHVLDLIDEAMQQQGKPAPIPSERASFEAYILTERGSNYLRRNDPAIDSMHDYEDSYVQEAWEAWQARGVHETTPNSVLEEQVRHLERRIRELTEQLNCLKLDSAAPQAPIAKIIVRESGAAHYAPDLIDVKMCAPGLPPGEHDVYLDPTSPGLGQETTDKPCTHPHCRNPSPHNQGADCNIGMP